jgi:hypothetical protein
MPNTASGRRPRPAPYFAPYPSTRSLSGFARSVIKWTGIKFGQLSRPSRPEFATSRGFYAKVTDYRLTGLRTTFNQHADRTPSAPAATKLLAHVPESHSRSTCHVLCGATARVFRPPLTSLASRPRMDARRAVIACYTDRACLVPCHKVPDRHERRPSSRKQDVALLHGSEIGGLGSVAIGRHPLF